MSEEGTQEPAAPPAAPPTEDTSVLAKAEAVAQRMEQANAKSEMLLMRQEELLAKKMLSGRADAGSATQDKEETPKEYKDRVMRGEL